jgi:hypothetical protein
MTGQRWSPRQGKTDAAVVVICKRTERGGAISPEGSIPSPRWPATHIAISYDLTRQVQGRLGSPPPALDP